MNFSNLAAFIALMDTARNTYYAMLQDVRESQLKELNAINPANKKHEASIKNKITLIENKHRKTMKAFDKDMKKLVDSIKLADSSKERCVEASVDMFSDIMNKSIYKGASVPQGAYLLEQLKQKMFESKGQTVYLNHGEVKIYVDAEVWKAEKGDFKGVEVRVIDGKKVVVL